MRRIMGRLGVLLIAVLAVAGLAAGPASAAKAGPITPAGMGFTCSFDVPIGSGVRVDICLERKYAPGLQVRAITWLENGSSQSIMAQFSSTVQGVGGAFCGLASQSPGSVRACQSSLYWDFDGPNDNASSMITWRLGSGAFTVDNVSSPTG